MSALIEKLEPGEVSEISQQAFGCTALKLVERNSYEPISYEQAEDRLYREIEQRKLEEEFTKWMDDLRASTYIKRRGFFADAADLDDPTSHSKESARESLLQ
jgi:parvulin-like peptidyl-prolyl isomerase